jgi:hypothetical protein
MIGSVSFLIKNEVKPYRGGRLLTEKSLKLFRNPLFLVGNRVTVIGSAPFQNKNGMKLNNFIPFLIRRLTATTWHTDRKLAQSGSSYLILPASYFSYYR